MQAKRPEIFIFPGLDGQPALRQEIAAILSDRYQVHTLPLPHDTSMDYGALARWFADQLPEGPMVVVGESFSGPLVALITQLVPHEVVGVVFISTFVKRTFPPILTRMLQHFPVKSVPFGVIDRLLTGGRGSAGLKAKLRSSLRDMPESVISHRGRLASDIDVTATLESLPQPILVIHGSRDRIIRRAKTKEFLKARPDAQVVIIDGPHMILETHAAEVAEAIASFVLGIRRPA